LIGWPTRGEQPSSAEQYLSVYLTMTGATVERDYGIDVTRGMTSTSPFLRRA
jgi:hypothetical protein